MTQCDRKSLNEIFRLNLWNRIKYELVLIQSGLIWIHFKSDWGGWRKLLIIHFKGKIWMPNNHVNAWSSWFLLIRTPTFFLCMFASLGSNIRWRFFQERQKYRKNRRWWQIKLFVLEILKDFVIIDSWKDRNNEFKQVFEETIRAGT